MMILKGGLTGARVIFRTILAKPDVDFSIIICFYYIRVRLHGVLS